MICKSCGQHVAPVDRYCVYCRERLYSGRGPLGALIVVIATACASVPMFPLHFNTVIPLVVMAFGLVFALWVFLARR
jgi:hypothetical protein